jgi:hypothetical protein
MRLDEGNIEVSGTRRADVTGVRDIWQLMAKFGLANARPRGSILARRAGHPADVGLGHFGF